MAAEHAQLFNQQNKRGPVPRNRPNETQPVPCALQYNPHLITSAGALIVRGDALVMHNVCSRAFQYLKPSMQTGAMMGQEQHAHWVKSSKLMVATWHMFMQTAHYKTTQTGQQNSTEDKATLRSVLGSKPVPYAHQSWRGTWIWSALASLIWDACSLACTLSVHAANQKSHSHHQANSFP
jgi:hypothetical protein